MADWLPGIEDPVGYDYAGHTVLKCGAWSQGPVFLQQLALLAGFDLAAMDPLGADFVHTVVECMKLAFADREAFYGDPAFTDVPLGTLLSRDYNDARRRLVGAEGIVGAAARHGRQPVPLGRPRRRGAGRHADPGARRGRTRRWARMGVTGARHGAYRRDRPVGQHGQRHTVRRLAAILPRDPGPGLLPRHARADVLAAARAAQQPGRPASARARRCPRRWRCGTASPGWRSARRAVSSRTSGRRSSSCGGCITGSASRPRSTCHPSTPSTGRAASGHGAPSPASWCWKAATAWRCGTSWPGAATSSRWARTGPRVACPAADIVDGVMHAGANARGMQGYAVGR